MKYYDVRYSLGYDRSHAWRYQERIKALNELDAKEKIIEKCKRNNVDEKIMNIRINNAQDFICWTYRSYKTKDNIYAFKKEYYCGYQDLKVFGKATIYSEKQENAKRFEIEQELKDELKKLNHKLSDYKIEKVSVN